MKNTKKVKSITLAGILAAIYLVMTLISIYVAPVVSILGLMIMPIFAAYYASIYDFKEVLIFNIATFLICFLIGVSDPMYAILYVLPTLIIGDVFGILNKLKIKYYTTMFLQAIAYSITNILALYFAQWFYEIEIIKFIISDEFIYQNFSLTILFVLSGAEAIFSSIFINEQLNKLNIKKEKEKSMSLFGYFLYIVLYILMIITYYISYNIYFLIIFMLLILCVPLYLQIEKNVKYKKIIYPLFIIIYITINFYFCYKSMFYLIPILLFVAGFIYCIVKTISYIYNIHRRV